jgi:hypothetical protein
MRIQATTYDTEVTMDVKMWIVVFWVIIPESRDSQTFIACAPPKMFHEIHNNYECNLSAL